MGSRLMRLDEIVAKDIERHKKLLEEQYNIEVTHPRASLSWFEKLKEGGRAKELNKFLGVK